MSKGSGGTRSGRSGGSSSANNPVPNTPEGVQYVKQALQSYSKTDKWNKNTAYNMGFNDDAQSLIEKVANGNYGFASQVAQTAVNSPNWNNSGYQLSEKQAYVIAKAAVENKLASQDKVIFDMSVGKAAAAKEAAKSAQKAAKYAEYSANYKKSSTKVAVGSSVVDSKGRKGVISSIITKSSGYVTVKYSDGTTGKAMAFNLFGADGNPLKKKPKN